MSSSPVLIAGAGVAGLTAAIALARAGVPVILAEKRAGFSEVGAGLQLSPNATSVLAKLGLLSAVRRHAVQPRRLDIRRWGSADPVGGMAMRSEAEADGAPFLSIMRADLQTALLDELRMTSGVKLMVGRSVIGHVQSERGVAVTLQTERGHCDEIEVAALIGADGLWSSVRGELGDGAAPRFLGYEAWRTLIPAEAAPSDARQAVVNLWLGREGHAVHYPVASGRLVNLVVIRNGREVSQDWSRPGDAGLLHPLAARAAPMLAGLIGAAPSWQVWSLFDRAPAVMAKGRVALIGDAAHPVLPFLAQGAALGIEDAGVLAKMLVPALASPGAGAVQAALTNVARARRTRVAQVQDTARRNGRIYHAGFPVSLARDLVLRNLGDEGMRKRHDWIYGWRMDA